MFGGAGRLSVSLARSVLDVLLPLSARTPAPTTATAATSSFAVARASLASWRRAHKSIVDVDDLLEQLRAVGVLDSGLCIVKGGVLDEAVALLDHQCQPKYCRHGARVP